MNENTISETFLESCNDVFADIVNGLFFGGENQILPEDLINQEPCNAHKEFGFKRVVSKRWTRYDVRISIISLDKQTVPTDDMPLRVFGYESAEYAAQGAGGEKRCQIVTLVLYYGTEKRWDKARSLSEATNVSERFEFFQVYRMNLFEVAYLEPDVVERFKSDFRVVADYFGELRRIGEYMQTADEMDHGQAVRKFLERLAFPKLPDC